MSANLVPPETPPHPEAEHAVPGTPPLPERKRRAIDLGLTETEYSRICELLGREPNGVELAMFSLLWSEHCAYKHSRKLLRR
ncbi:MAG: hypothetical protein ACXWZM_06460, partial [Solirubrobacterales bacterium]